MWFLRFSRKFIKLLFALIYILMVMILISLQVRDRATLYLNTLGGDTEIDKDARDFLFGSLDIPLVNLETSLKKYVSSLYCYFFSLVTLGHISCFLFDCRSLRKRLLTLIWCPRSLSLLPRRKPLVKSQLVVWVLLLVGPHPLWIHMKGNFCQFLSLQTLGSFLRFFL
jgi:hypothetical protein